MTPIEFATALGLLLTDIGTIVTSIIGWATSVVGFIVGKPLILLCCVVPLAGYAFITVKGFLHN